MSMFDRNFSASKTYPLLKGMIMASNKNSRSGGSGGTRGGTPEQHAEAGRQSHKNDNKR